MEGGTRHSIEYHVVVDGAQISQIETLRQEKIR